MVKLLWHRAMCDALLSRGDTPTYSPCDAHHHSDNDGDLDGADDGGNKDVVQLLATRDDVEDVKVMGLVAQGAFVARITPDTCINTQHIHRTEIIQRLSPQKQNSISVSVNCVSTALMAHTPAGGRVVLDLTFPVDAAGGVAVSAGNGHPSIESISMVVTFGL